MWYGFAYGRTKDERLERLCQKLIAIKQICQEIKFIFINNIRFKKINVVSYVLLTVYIVKISGLLPIVLTKKGN